MTVAPGTRLGIYSVKTRLGAGGMGEVFRATDTRLKRDVAIKVLPPQVSGDPTRLARFRREAELLASLNHPNIAHVNGLEEADGVIALVMELVEGEDLSTRLSQGPLAIGEALRIAHQVAAALDSAHEHGIIHRDLKPGNIRVRPDGMVKVLDFGLARSVAATGIDESTRTAISSTGAISGTPAYMSPEQARGTDTSRETDVWTFGVVVYELLTAVSPLARTSAADTLAAVLTAPVDESLIPKETPHSVRRLISRCLERDPQQRWRSMGDARLTIEDALTRGAGPGDTVRGTGSPTSVTRRRALVYGAASMALSATGFGVGTTLSRRGSPATAPSFRRLTFRRGLVRSARFAPDGETILYGALWDGEDCRIHAVRINAPESQPLDLPNANLLAVSRAGELAVALGPHRTGTITYGTLARVPMTGGAPRPLVEDVKFADWSPDSRDLAIVRRVDGRDRLEFPVGNVLFAPNLGEATGIGFPRVSSDGRHVAFIHYTSPGSISGRVALVNQAGTVTRLSEDSLNIHGLAWTRDAVLFTAADRRPT